LTNGLAACRNIADLRARARKRLPAPMFHYIDGGADDEWSLVRNTAAFDEYQLVPSQLRDVSQVDLSIRVLGCHLELPFILSPTGMSRLFHHDREIGVARAAHRAGTMYTLSTMATASIEDIASASVGAKMFQIYMFKDRELTHEFVVRAKAAGYQALCLTVDTPVAGNRERDILNGMTIPPRLSHRNMFSYASRWRWLYHLARHPDLRLANIAHRASSTTGAMGLIEYVGSQFDRSVTWDDAAWLAAQWDGPFVIKGLQTPEDARRAAAIGASAVMISNHGGRQLDGAPAPIDCVAAIRDIVGDAIELIVDGGIRRGSHVVKALALGANACSIGRAYLWGLAAGGERGVGQAIEILRAEVERTMTLMGATSIADLSPATIRRS
jgi:L-lactate dehydrogenase (cytochrome)